MVKDLVCSMDVNEDKAAASSSYKGKKYYFCSPVCKTKFDENPEKYLNREVTKDKEVDLSDQTLQCENAAKPENKQGTATERIDLPIVGMSCASCALRVQQDLSHLKGVEKANVNFATSKATLSFKPQVIKPEDFIASIRKSGYEVGTVTVELPLKGIQCASCVQIIEKALLQTKGVTKASVNLATERANVEYLPTETSLGEIKRIIESTGYEVLDVSPSDEGLDPEK